MDRRIGLECICCSNRGYGTVASWARETEIAAEAFGRVHDSLKYDRRTRASNMLDSWKSLEELLSEPKPVPVDLRDRCQELSKTDSEAALRLARAIDIPWYKSQALSWVARYSESEVCAIAAEAADAAARGGDIYERVAVRAWEIAALAERGLLEEARRSLNEVIVDAPSVEPSASRAEALILLLHAGLRIGEEEGDHVCTVLDTTCGKDCHWRCKRALKDAHKLCSGEAEPRKFFW